MTQQINPEAIMQRLRQLLADLEAPGWQVHIRVVCHHPTGRVTFEVGEHPPERVSGHAAGSDDPSR
jgi:hypothetical protein